MNQSTYFYLRAFINPMDHQQRLTSLQLARNAIAAFLESGSIIDPPNEPPFILPSGVFVSLKAGSELRGCIGYSEPRFALGTAIVQAAILAATDDPRFPRLTRSELDSVRIEVSVLSTYQEIADPLQIQVGVHGILLVSGPARGLLLPQVPIEHGWTLEDFLIYGCRKAGVPDYAWKLPITKIFVFTAEVFGEPKS